MEGALSGRSRGAKTNCVSRFPMVGIRATRARKPDVMAENIATWVWSGGKPLDCSPPAQRRRGVKSGKVRRAKVADKDALVVAAFEGGSSIHVISQMDGRDRRAIRHVLRREIPLILLDNRPASIEAIKPWDA